MSQKSLCQFYDTTLEYDWDMDPVDRSLDPDKIKAYLSLFTDQNDREFISELLEKTYYINYKSYKDNLTLSFDDFYRSMKDTSFYILTSILEETKSNDWITAILWPYISKMNISGFITIKSLDLSPGTYHLVLFDDASYSGGNIFSYMDELTYGLSEKNNFNPNELRKNGYYFHFHIVIPFISKLVEEDYTPENLAKYMDWDVTLYNIHSILGLNKEINLSKYYSKYYNKRPGDIGGYDKILQEKFEFEVPDRPMLYLDNKIASSVSTYPQIYLEGKIPNRDNFGPLLKELPSRYKIDQLDQMFLDYTLNSREINLSCI